MSEKRPPAATGIDRVIKAASYSWQGIQYAFRNEAAFRQESVLLAIAVVTAIISDTSITHKILLISSVTFVLVVEIINSAIEAVVDRFGEEFHPLSKAAKDMGSAAVLIALILAAIIWLLVFFG